MTDALVKVDETDGVGVLTLNDPDRRNAMTGPMVDEIIAAVDRFESDSGVGALVVTGTPPAFCAGADLGDLGGTTESREGGLRGIYEGFLRIARSPLPTIAAVNGAAVGAGMNLALGCDVRIGARRAKFDTRFLQLGLHPGGGHTWMLQRIVGPQVAKAMVLFGEVLDGEAAATCGLAWRCVDDDSLLEAALTMARRAAGQPRELTCRAKATINDMWAIGDHDKAVDRELVDQVWSLTQPEFAERLRALQAKITSR